MIRIAAQTGLITGDGLREKHDNALAMGLDGIELSGASMIDQAEEAVAEQVPISAICSGFRGWFIDPDPGLVRACIEDSKRLLELTADLQAPLIIVPIFGRTRFLPAHCGTGRTAEEDEALWLEGLHEVVDHADRVGGRILIEPINRYQNSVCNSLADAVRFARMADSPNVKVMGDTFHMNIEEADVAASLEEAMPYLGYVHLSDSNRREPGQGHVDFVEVFSVLRRNDYEGWATMECILSDPEDPDCLRRATSVVRSAMAQSEMAA